MTSILLSVGTISAAPATQPATAPANVLRVAIYDDGGGSNIGPENVEGCVRASNDFTFCRVTARTFAPAR